VKDEDIEYHPNPKVEEESRKLPEYLKIIDKKLNRRNGKYV